MKGFIAGLVTGLFVGSGITYALTVKKMTVKCHKEIEEMREYVNNELSNSKNKEILEESQKNAIDISENASTGLVERQNGIVDGSKSSIDYNRVIDHLNYSKPEEKIDVIGNEGVTIYGIDSEIYCDDISYEKGICSYFQDGVLMWNDGPEAGHVVDEGLTIVGGLEMLNDCIDVEDPDNAYVRNELIGMDIQVMFEDCKYEDYLDMD